MLLVLNFPLISIFINILKVPSRILMPIVLLLCILGVFSVNNSLVDIWIMMLFGLLGFMMRKGEFDPAPVALAVVIGPVIEKAFRHSLMLSRGEPSIFITRPFSCIMLAAAFVIIIWPLLWRLIRMFLTKSRNNV